MHSRSLPLVLAAVLSACGSTPQASKKTSSSSGSTAAAGSTGASGSSGTTEGSSGTTGGSSGGASSGSSGASASSGTSGSSGSHGASSSSGSTGGACVGDGQFVGPGNGSQCCTGAADAQGFCTFAGGTGGAGSSGGSGGSGGTTGSTICTSQRCVVYAHTAQDLYQIDPANPNASTYLCSFIGIGADVFDLAVRRDGVIFAITATELYRVDPANCQGTYLATLQSASQNFNGLAFTVGDVLLAADSFGQVTSINTQTGATQVVGNYNGYGSSGDLVTLSNGTIYATAIDLSGGSFSDVLVSLDPVTYQATPIGPIGYSSIYGLAYWAGNLYGFDQGGDVLQIDPTTGQATPLAGAHSGLPWYGAGTTPLAPIVNR